MEEIRAVLELGEVPQEYTFRIDRRQEPPILHIPGDQRGPDICLPHKPEQEHWLNGLVELVAPVWHCQWTFTSEKACDDFIEYLTRIEPSPPRI